MPDRIKACIEAKGWHTKYQGGQGGFCLKGKMQLLFLINLLQKSEGQLLEWLFCVIISRIDFFDIFWSKLQPHRLIVQYCRSYDDNTEQNYLFGSSDTNPSQRAEDELDLRWQYLLDPVAPNWPEPVYSGQPFGATKSTFSSDIELSLLDRDLWEQWDLSYLNASPAPGPESILKSVPPDSDLATISRRRLLSPISQISTEGVNHGVMNLSKDDYFRANAKCSSAGMRCLPDLESKFQPV